MASEFPDDLKDAVHHGKLLPFAGAGVSMAVKRIGDTKPAFPSWPAFLHKAAEALDGELLATDAETVRRYLAETPPRYLEAAQLVYEGLKRRGWARLLRRHFLLKYSTIDSSTLRTAQALWKLSDAIVTSNFDLVLRWACPRHQDLREWGLDDPHGLVELQDGPLDNPAVWHMHGTIVHPHDIVLALDGYKKLYIPGEYKRWEKALDTLRRLLTVRTFLFVGFSFADQYFTDQVEHIAKLYDEAGRIHYMLLRKDSEYEATEARLKPLPIRCIPYSDHGEPLIRVLEDLASFRGGAVSGDKPPTESGGGATGSGSTYIPSVGSAASVDTTSTATVANAPAVDAIDIALTLDGMRAERDALLLLGNWSPASEGDRDAAVQLGGDPTSMERLCADLARLELPLVRHQVERGGRGHWTWTRPKETWRRVLPGVPPTLLDRFAQVARTVLGEHDPSLDMPPDERYLAPIQGKRWRFSAPLREGIATNLVRLSESDDLLRPLYGTSRGSLLAHIVIRDVLSSEWHVWASLNALLPYLAEAAPATFLDRVEVSLASGPLGVVHLLTQESRLGHGWHTGLLWGLETLGWRPELVSRVAVALARLAKNDPGGNLANRPIRSLENLLHPIMPQSRSSGDERMRVLRAVAAREAVIGWRAALDMFKNTLPSGGVMFPSRRPQIAQWNVPADAETEAVDAAQQAADLLTFLLESCGTDPARWAGVLALALQMSFEDAQRVLKAFATVTVETSDGLCGTLRELLHNAYEFGEAWSVSSDIVLRLEEQYRRLAPDDPVARISWLFGARVLLPEVTGDWDDELAKIAKHQAEALADLWTRDDRQALLARLAATVESPNKLGYALGGTSYADEVERLLLTSSDRELSRVLPSFAARRYHQLRATWLADVLTTLMNAGRRNDVLAVLINIRPEPEIWDLIEQHVPDLKLDYWRAVGTLFGPFSPSQWTRALHALLQAGRPAQALESASHAETDLEPATALAVLIELASAPATELHALAASGTGAYYLERVFSALDRSSEDIPLEKRVSLELAFLGFLERSPNTTRHLFSALERQPELFTQLIVALYKPQDDPSSMPSSGLEASDSSISEGGRNAAVNAHHVLHAWRGYPGLGEPADVADRIALRWCEEALALTQAAHRMNMGAYEVGRVLARMPEAADGVWPSIAARELLKRPEAPAIADGLSIGKRNARGVVTRRFGDGGDQERALSEKFRTYADALRNEWPEAAGVVDELSAAYAREAEEHDEIAKADRGRYGSGDKHER